MRDADVAVRRVALPEVSLHVAEAGPAGGPPTILLHGFPESGFGWRGQVAPLAGAGFRLVIPDQRGYGRSDKPSGLAAYHLDRLADDVIDLADACGFARIRLVGHDWGGLVAWWVASRHPERIARLAIVNAPHPSILGPYLLRHPGQWLRSSYVGLFQIPGLPERRLTARGGAALRRALTASSRPGTFTEAELDRYAQDWLRPGAMTAMLGWYRALVRLRRDRPARVRAPTLILWGRRDHALQPGLAEASLGLCDDGRIAWFPEASHWLQHEEPAAVNAALIAFLRG